MPALHAQTQARVEPSTVAAPPPVSGAPATSGASAPATPAAATAKQAPTLSTSEAIDLLRAIESPAVTADQGPHASAATAADKTEGGRVDELLSNALSYIGVRYRYGGNTPERGFDCSGLVRWVYNRTWGVMLPRRAAEIAKVGTSVPKEQLQPGDLVFFNTLRRTFSHVGIYLGDGQFLHAPRSGGKVRVEKLDQAYWMKRWNGARRLDSDEAPDAPASTPPVTVEATAAPRDVH